MLHLLPIFFVTLTCAYVICDYLQRRNLYKEAAKFPGPRSFPIIGNAHIFIGNTNDIYKTCKWLVDTFVSPFRVWLGHRLFYVCYDPEQLKIILNSPKAIEKEDLYKFWEPWIGTGLLTAPATKWKVHRKLITPTFKTQILRSFVEIFSAKSNVLIAEMESQVNGKEFQIYKYIALCTLDMIIETAMGVSSNTQNPRDSTFIDATEKLAEIVYTRMFQIWLHFDFIFNMTNLSKQMDKYRKYVHALTDNVIKQKRASLDQENECNSSDFYSSGEKRKALLDLLMELNHDGAKFTDEELREEVDTFTVAGQDTTALVDSYILLILATYPDIQNKVYKELYDIYGSEDPSTAPVEYEDLHRMEYLERVIKETMRIFPLVPMIFRRVTEDLHMGDYTLSKGSSTVLAIFKTHRSEKYWKDPLKFDPDRFLPEECAKRHPYTFIPFSGGPRNCIGMKYAMMAMKTLIATVVRKYVLKKDNIVPIEDIKLKIDIVLKTVEPIMIRIEKRIHGNDQHITVSE